MSIQDNIRILDEEMVKLSMEKMTPSLAQNLNAYFGAKIALESLLKNPTTKEAVIIEQSTYNEYLPTINKYMQEQNEHNLKKVCLEIQEVCASIYATLKNDKEKDIYLDMVKFLVK